MEIERKQRSLVHFRRFADFGDLENGVPHGRGTMKSADGSFYEGDFEKTYLMVEVSGSMLTALSTKGVSREENLMVEVPRSNPTAVSTKAIRKQRTSWYIPTLRDRLFKVVSLSSTLIGLNYWPEQCFRPWARSLLF
jgi:hypothetical protein